MSIRVKMRFNGRVELCQQFLLLWYLAVVVQTEPLLLNLRGLQSYFSISACCGSVVGSFFSGPIVITPDPDIFCSP